MEQDIEIKSLQNGAAYLHHSESYLRIGLRMFIKSKTAIFGLIVVVCVIAVALLAGLIAPFDPVEFHPDSVLQSPSTNFLFGTDVFGRDVLSRVIFGSRISLLVGILSVGFAMIIGIPLGTIAGYFGGRWDSIIMRLIDVILAFPIFLLAIGIMVILGPSVSNVIIALAIVYIPSFTRVTRGCVLSIKENLYIEAARSLRLSHRHIIIRHVWPNAMAPLIVLASTTVAFAIIIEASLSFLGVGTQPPAPSWGFDLQANLIFLTIKPWLVLFPGLSIFITVLGFNMFGDGLRDALDPRLKI